MTSSGGGGSALSFSDRFFSYETFKVLRVRDRRLGGLYRLFQAAILLYIATTIIFQQRYLKTENIINGAVRVTLKAPADGIGTPGYCNSSTSPCIYWNENDILYNPGVEGALITTRAGITQYGPFNNQSTAASALSQCNVNVPTVSDCDPHKAPSTLLLSPSVMADIERFTLMLEHSIRGQATGLQMRSGNMESGLLRDSVTGEVLKTFTDQGRHVPITTSSSSENTVRLAGDVMTVDEFLRASGINLDELSQAPNTADGETVRQAGVVIIVVIQYAAKGWDPNRISYEYLPKAIPDQEYKAIETIRDFQTGRRVEINRHGIRIVFTQAGELGQFSLMTLLTNLVAAVALFKVANIIVELMMLRLHPQKKVYVRAKFESTKGTDDHRKDPKSTTKVASRQPLHEEVSIRSQSEMERGSACSISDQEDRRLNDRSTSNHGLQDENQSFKTDDCHRDENSDDEESGDEPVGSVGVRRRVNRAGQVSGSFALSSSIVRSRRAHASFGISTSTDLEKRSQTPAPSSGTADMGYDSSIKLDEEVIAFDWNRNGSSSALSEVGVPGVDWSSSRPGSIHVARQYSSDIEIETRFGPLRANESKGFNPGELSLSDAPTRIPSRSQIQHGMLKLRHQTDMDVQAGSSLAGWLATDRSPTTMQFVSPHPVYFDQHSSRQSISSARKGHRRSGRHASSKQGPSSTKRQSAESAFSRHSSRYHFPLTSSPSSSSLVSSGDDSESSANDRQSANSDMVLNIGSRGRHSSTLSFGAPKSPAHDGSSSAESITGPVSASASSPSSVSASDRTRLLDSGLDRSSRHAFKKQRKNYQFTTATSISSLQSKSETSLKRPIFGLEESSNLPAYSLSQSDSERTDTKGKRPDHSGYMTTSGGSSSKSHGPSTTFHPNLWNTVPDGGAVIDAIEVYNIDMTSIQPPFPSYLSQASSKAQDLNSVWSGGDNASSSVTSKHPKENDHDLPPLSGDWRFPTQVATPYRGIEIIKTISDNALKAPATSMGASAAVTGPELQTGSVSNFVPSLPRLASTEVIPATLERSRSSRSARSIPTVEIPRDESHISTHIERDTSGTSRMPIPCSDAISSTTSRSSNIDIATGSGHSSSCVRSSSSRSFETTHPHPNSSTLTTSFQTSSHAAPHSTMAIINHLSTTSLNYHTPINTDSAVGGTNTISVGMDYTSDSGTSTHPCYPPHPTSNFFTSPVTSSCITTMANTGTRVLGRTITIVTADNRRLVLRRSEPLILHEGVGEEKAARI